MTDYYDVGLKQARHKILKLNNKFFGYEGLIQDQRLLDNIYNEHKPNIIIHLAAQPGVRYSIENPQSYIDSNILGSFYIFELAKKFKPDHLLIGSTSSVYGNSDNLPFHENQKSDMPISLYAATKKSNEILAHSYSHLFSIPTTIFRFFTVYGPWGRPDMALFKFTKNILSKLPIDIYNYGNMERDFTNINDLVEAINLLIDVIPICPDKRKNIIPNDSLSNSAPYRIVNIGNSNSVNLLKYVEELENALKKKAIKNFIQAQKGDLMKTSSDITLLKNLTGFKPTIKLRDGIQEFVAWYISYYKENIY